MSNDHISPAQKTGKLRDIGVHRLGIANSYRYSECIDCGSQYPHVRFGASCNGHDITLCPWCRPDSAPWTAGRGV